jgi:hypothetical protein
MGELIDLQKFRKEKVNSPQVVAAQMVVEDLRTTLYALPSTQARVELMQILLAQLTLWIIKSNHYERPGEVIKTWVTRKVEQYTRTRSEG